MHDPGMHKILIVDDDEFVTKSLRRQLQSLDRLEIDTALNAKQAMNIINRSQQPFSLFISDLDMPGTKGNEFLARTKEIFPEARRIAISGADNIAIAIQAINQGSIHHYFTKPWDKKALIERVTKELKLYDMDLERKRLLHFTDQQTIRLFKLAGEMKTKSLHFKEEIKKKQEEIESLLWSIDQIQDRRKQDEMPLEIDAFLSKNIFYTPETIARSYSLIRKEIQDIFIKIATGHDLVLTPPDPGQTDTSNTVTMELKEALYELIDFIIDLACKKAEPALCEIKTGSDAIKSFNDYEELPAIEDLAHNEGFITGEELSRIKNEIEIRPDEFSKKSVYSFLLDEEYISRTDLSKLVVKRKRIETWILDQKMAATLLEKEILTPKKIDQAFVKQTNIFEDVGDIVPLVNILMEEKLITPETREQLITENGGPIGFSPHPGSPLDLGAVPMDHSMALDISKDKTKAYLVISAPPKKSTHVDQIKAFLEKHGVSFGIVDDHAITSFLTGADPSAKKLLVAQGRPPFPGTDAKIIYSFNTTYQQAGIVSEDGTIDFRDRGDIPIVKEKEVLARKIPLAKGTPGIDVFGIPIAVETPNDCDLKAGKGTRLSEDNLKVYSAIEGQPNLDIKGVISVFKELFIKGDIDYKTGHINFQGNVIVSGMVKEGFQVNCVNLTVNEIVGGIIEVSENLNVSSGIINAMVIAHGNVLAKFINHSTISVFGDLTILREIMESFISVNGECINEHGRITGSEIAARKGFVVGQVGTERSTKSVLSAGINGPVDRFIAAINQKITLKKTEIHVLENEKQQLKDRNFSLHKEVVDKSFSQEKLLEEQRILKNKCNDLKGNRVKLIENRKENKRVENKLTGLDMEIKAIFKVQNDITEEIEAVEGRIKDRTCELEEFEIEKEAILELAELEEHVPVVRVNKKVFAGTRIVGPQTSMTVRNNLGRCKIMEIKSSDPDDPDNMQMVIQNF